MKPLINFLQKVILQLIMMLFVFIPETTAQNHQLLNSDHIPLMGLHHSAWHGEQQKIPLYPKLKEMGLEGVIFGDVSQNMFNGFSGLNDQMKLIPWQVHQTLPAPPVNFINEYTSAVYTIWQAHDTGISPLKAALKFHPDIGERVPGNPNTIRTKPYASQGQLITGPGYNQRIKYANAVNWSPDFITYRATFNLKIEQNELYPDPPQSTEGLTDPLCTLKVVVKEIAYETGIGFYIKDSLDWVVREVLVNELEFDEWKNFNIQFTYEDLPPNFKFAAEENDYADFVEFYIEWMGVDYARLYFDTLLVSDERGRSLFNDPVVRSNIMDQANNLYNGIAVFNENTVGFETTGTGFYGQDEPGSIDNLEPIRKVGELMSEETNGERPLFISIAMSWNGKWGDSPFGTHPIDHNQEFYNRAQPDGFLMQTHIYDSENLGSINEVGSQIWRIQTTYIPNLISLQSTAPTYSVLVQTAKWLPWVEVNPNSEQLRFSVYLALLYGSKGIFFDQVFAKDDDLVGGIINAYDNPPTFSPLFDEIKDNIYPRTSGLFGITLRNTQQTYQQSDYDAITAADINRNKIKKIEASLHGNVSQLDFGFFDDTSDTAKDYFMIVNRYYSNKVNFNVHLYNLIDYSNWAVKNYMDSTSVTVTLLTGNEAVYNTDIELGDAGFYSVLPVVKYGGRLIYDEEIVSETLYDDMVIENGATLSISGDYYVDADIIVKEGGRMVNTGNGKITFYNDHKLILQGNSN